MADITMCKGNGCPKKVQCYRYSATVNHYRQSYFITVPIKEDKSCDHFIDNKGWTK